MAGHMKAAAVGVGVAMAVICGLAAWHLIATHPAAAEREAQAQLEEKSQKWKDLERPRTHAEELAESIELDGRRRTAEAELRDTETGLVATEARVAASRGHKNSSEVPGTESGEGFDAADAATLTVKGETAASNAVARGTFRDGITTMTNKDGRQRSP